MALTRCANAPECIPTLPGQIILPRKSSTTVWMKALAGFASHIKVTLHKDQSLEVVDDGRGMPTDIHPEHGISGIELILTRLHAGGKFSNKKLPVSLVVCMGLVCLW